MKQQNSPYVAFFDLDNTILSVNSGSVIVREAYRRREISRTGLMKAMLMSVFYKYHLRKTSSIIDEMGGWLKGRSLIEIKDLIGHALQNFLLDLIRPEILEEIRIHKENNAELVMLSSAIEELCNPIAEHLGFYHTICTRMEIIDGVYTGFPDGKYCFEEEKGNRLLAYCEERGMNPGESWYYGDSIADLPALELVGNPVCVAPDKKLESIGMDREWKILPAK